MKNSSFVTIPKAISGKEELVVMPRKVLDRLLQDRLDEEKLLRISREAEELHKAGKLPILRSLRDLR